MAENVTIARPYAEAAFAFADAGGSLAKWAQALEAMAGITAHPEMRSAIGNPGIVNAELYGLVAALAIAGAEQILRREVDQKAHADLLSSVQSQL